ncbi:hypothetical protein THRCLA_22775 [Thraustotheca clavata]|uniref:Serine-threonine/tyrosine-protein kinase catalytic domain-containing protein n=1 Tax=Thraustotheca clavata TaxID=74557 RepID=A0A1V9YTD7_9STRA|nr:hypothetical protein THRCLA_22775 [Thraustotheca clavata]
MWETFNEQSPFGGLTGAEAAAHVLSGNRLELSNAIPLKLQDVMIDCFAIDPSKRPSMYEILLALSDKYLSKNVQLDSYFLTRLFEEKITQNNLYLNETVCDYVPAGPVLHTFKC